MTAPTPNDSEPRLADRSAQAWTLVACVAFLFATAYAIAVVVFRLPIAGLREPLLFRTALALHVELAVYFWLMATMAAAWSAANRAPKGRAATGLPLLAACGTLLTVVSPLAGGTPLMADYFPWLTGNGLFATGFGLFTLAVAVAALGAIRAMLTGLHRAGWGGIAPSSLAVVAALLTLAADGLHGARDLATLAWGAGHTLLFAHVALMCWEWGRFASESESGSCTVQCRAAMVLGATSLLMPVIPFLFEPGSAAHVEAFTFAMRWLLWPPALVAGLATLVTLWRARDRQSPVPLRLAVTLAFGFLVVGCVLGAMIEGATTLVTAHYHAAIGSVALTRMAFTYRYADRVAFGTPSHRAARGQLRTYALALLLLVAGLVVGSIDSAPRKTSAGELVEKGPWFRVGMSVSGVGGLFAIAGSVWLIVNVAGPARRRRVRPG